LQSISGPGGFFRARPAMSAPDDLGGDVVSGGMDESREHSSAEKVQRAD